MKKISLSVIICIIALNTFAQKIRFKDTTNVWHFYQTNCGTGFLHYDSSIKNYYSGIYTAFGHTYNVLHANWSQSGQKCYIREDTLLNKVYIIPNNILSYYSSIVDTSEYLLYDYNWNVGDTVSYNLPTLSKSICWVTHKDSILINSIWHKTWQFAGIDTFFVGGTYAMGDSINYLIIEGLGCTNDVYYSLYPIYISSGVCNYIGSLSDELTCFYNKGNQAVISATVTTKGVEANRNFDNAASCASTKYNEIKTVTERVHLFPNPISEESKLIFDKPIIEGKLLIYNYLGQVIYKYNISNISEITIGNELKQKGIYYYLIQDNINDVNFSGCFVK